MNTTPDELLLQMLQSGISQESPDWVLTGYCIFLTGRLGQINFARGGAAVHFAEGWKFLLFQRFLKIVSTAIMALLLSGSLQTMAPVPGSAACWRLMGPMGHYSPFGNGPHGPLPVRCGHARSAIYACRLR